MQRGAKKGNKLCAKGAGREEATGELRGQVVSLKVFLRASWARYSWGHRVACGFQEASVSSRSWVSFEKAVADSAVSKRGNTVSAAPNSNKCGRTRLDTAQVHNMVCKSEN